MPTMYLPLAAQESPGSRITLTAVDVDRGPVDRGSADRRRAARRRSRPDLLDPRLRSVHPRRPDPGAPGGHAVGILRRAGPAARGDRPLRRRRPRASTCGAPRSACGSRSAPIASASSVLVFRRVAVMLALGLAAGLGLSLWASRFVGALLFQLEPRDVTDVRRSARGADRGERAGCVDPGAAGVPPRSGPGAARRLICGQLRHVTRGRESAGSPAA